MIDNVVIGERNWLDIYGSSDPRSEETWIVCKLANGEDLYSCVTDKINGIKEYCVENNTHVISAGLQFRSHTLNIDAKDADAVYIVKSVRGQMGGHSTHCVVLGSAKDGIVSKQAYCTPELLKIYDSEDNIEDCFEEMLIYNDKKANRKK